MRNKGNPSSKNVPLSTEMPDSGPMSIPSCDSHIKMPLATILSAKTLSENCLVPLKFRKLHAYDRHISEDFFTWIVEVEGFYEYDPISVEKT
jgi:hypothetical protein